MFEWRRGQEPETQGIYVSDKFFKINNRGQNSKPLALLLLDCEGAFDHRSTLEDVADIFLISTLISSFQITNVMRQIQSSDLTNLQFFNQIGQSVVVDDEINLFNDFMFVIRDFEHADEYGTEAGMTCLKKIKKQQEELIEEKSCRLNEIERMFESFNVFCLPRPGKQVLKDQFDGNLKELDEDFLKHSEELIEFIVKNFESQPLHKNSFICAKDLKKTLLTNIEMISSSSKPDVKHFIELRAEQLFNDECSLLAKFIVDQIDQHLNEDNVIDQNQINEKKQVIEDSIENHRLSRKLMMKEKYKNLLENFSHCELQKKLLARSKIISKKYENQQLERKKEEERLRLAKEKKEEEKRRQQRLLKISREKKRLNEEMERAQRRRQEVEAEKRRQHERRERERKENERKIEERRREDERRREQERQNEVRRRREQEERERQLRENRRRIAQRQLPST